VALPISGISDATDFGCSIFLKEILSPPDRACLSSTIILFRKQLILRGEKAMNSDQWQGKWKQVKGSIKERWGKLTDDDLDVIAGQRDQLAGRIQERYGIAKEEARKEVDEWMRMEESHGRLAETHKAS
jgi:uncharacterized protein YjbJ (UPF0337 family)